MTHHIGAPPRWIARNRSRDHPRSRGVYFAGQDAINPPRGSSPLARGLLGRGRSGEGAGRPGIIPARAGFTRPLEALTRSSQDHPRSRGVYSRPLRALISIQGSSPLARGLLGATREGQKVVRIIPARAGFTDVSPDLMIESADHPRSRGVYRRATGLPPAPHGSSPLARGLRALGFHPDSWVRIIPARAGFTRSSRTRTGGSEDHPRSRGVYSRSCAPSGREPGSSPLARGLPAGSNPASPTGGIIPARAGFTSPCE